MSDEPQAPRLTVDREAIFAHLNAAYQRRTPVAIWTALADIPVMLIEIGQLAQLLSRARRDFANLLAAARTALDAARDGEPDPLSYLRDEVAAHGAWPPADDGTGR